MPRYCAATCCRNRAGQSARDQRKLSFYPFPLHDRERLEKWLRNMKRDTWIPSKHQVLCSDHFTPDSLDVRWGIRYLKTTAVPTIFSTSDNQGKGVSQRKMQDKLEDVKKRNTGITTSSLKPCSLKENGITEQTLYGKVLSTDLSKPPGREETTENSGKTEDDLTYPNSSVKLNMEHTNSVLIAANVQNAAVTSNSSSSENYIFNNSVDNLLSNATTVLQASVCDLHSYFEPLADSKVTVFQAPYLEHFDSSLEFSEVTVPINDLAPDQLGSHIARCAMAVEKTDGDSVLLHTMTQALEQFSGKESIIAIIVPSEDSRSSLFFDSSFIPAEQELAHRETEKSVCITSYSDIDVLQTEHSYCRQDTDREQLWQKILKLHSKIALLEIQERKTLSRLKALEALIAKLKQENLLSEEKLKIVENCFTTFEVTMIQ
uniref:THAP domain-containing protein 5 n=1 Tax=Salvator merianae TaxID=96440 RepID=A0A8D0EAV7_SALMN